MHYDRSGPVGVLSIVQTLYWSDHPIGTLKTGVLLETFSKHELDKRVPAYASGGCGQVAPVS